MIAIPVVIVLAFPAIAKLLYWRRAGGADTQGEALAAILAFVVGCLLTVPATWLAGVPMSEGFGGNLLLGILTTAGIGWFAGDEMLVLAQQAGSLPVPVLRTPVSLGLVLGWPLITPALISYAFGSAAY